MYVYIFIYIYTDVVDVTMTYVGCPSFFHGLALEAGHVPTLLASTAPLYYTGEMDEMWCAHTRLHMTGIYPH